MLPAGVLRDHAHGLFAGALDELHAKGLFALGLEAVEALESDHDPRKHDIEELKAITAEYRAKTRELKKGQAA